MIVTALLLLAVQAQTVPPTPPPAPTTTSPAADPDKKICRREMATGSNMSRKVCHTRAEWTRQMRENGGAAEGLRGAMGTCHGTGCT